MLGGINGNLDQCSEVLRPYAYPKKLLGDTPILDGFSGHWVPVLIGKHFQVVLQQYHSSNCFIQANV